MNLVTKGLLDDFLEKSEIKNSNESENFENFCNYSIVKNEFNNDFEYDDVSTGNGYQGIDGIAIIVNNKYIYSIPELDEIIENEKKLNVTFVLIQSKTSSSFDGSQILNFINTSKDFFNVNPELSQTEEVKNKWNIVQYIYSKSSKLNNNPKLKLYYVTTGIWNNDNSLLSIINNKKQLENLNSFSLVDFKAYGESEIQKSYRDTLKTVSSEFTFTEMAPLPPIDGVSESYIGCVNFKEFKKIIIDDNGSVKNIFYDNVRDFLGNNENNSKITKDVSSGKFDLFPLLNNGVTIVANEGRVVRGREFFIEKYQIVNGCQTSHVLFNNKDVKGIDNLYIPIKVIVTKDDNIKNNITIATNSQTAIKEEELIAFSEFQKNLEEFYKSASNKYEILYYERRTGQFDYEQDCKKTRIVTVKNQIKTFSSMFLDKPHLASGKYKQLFNEVKGYIFKDGNIHLAYYLSSLLLYKLEGFIRNKDIDKKYNKVRLHILMMFRVIYFGDVDMDKLNSKALEKRCDKLLEIVLDDYETLNLFKNILKLIDLSGIDISNQRSLFTSGVRDNLKDIAIKNSF